MTSRLSQLVAVAGSLFLVLPAGFCNAAAACSTCRTASASQPCCDHAAKETFPEAPVRPDQFCCCERDIPVPEKPVERPCYDAAVPWQTNANTLLPVLTGLASRDALTAALPAGPRLHVLKCVWLC